DYFEALNITSTKTDGVKFEIDGAITDQYGMVIFFTIHSDHARDQMRLHDVTLKDDNDNDLKYSLLSFGVLESDKDGKAFRGMLEYEFNQPIDTNSFHLDVEVTGSPFDGTMQTAFNDTFEIPFTVTKEILEP